MQWAQQDSNL